jgi:prepilin-type N-terminal cleavage/methylation domain-containing protein
MSAKSFHLRGFSLIEVSAVIVIIGILIAGVFAGVSLIKKARIQAAQTLTKSSPIAGIPSNALWLESSLEDSFLDSESSNTDAISTWIDQKVTGSKSSITKVGTGPTYANTINYVHAVKFSGSTANYLKIADASFLNDTDYTIVVLEKRQAASAGNFLSTTNNSDVVDNKLAIGYASDGVIAHSHNATNYTVTPKVSAYSNSTETPRLFVFTQSSTEGKKTYINGTLAAQDTSNTSQLSGVTTLAIGKGYTGEIGEIAIFTKALSKLDRKIIEDYIGKKWTRKLNRSVVSRGATGGSSDNSGNPSCINGTVTDSASSGCGNSCTVSVTGVSTPSSVVDGASGNLTCDSSLGYSGTITYNCSGGNLNASPSACTTTTCTITSVAGFNDATGLTYASSATALSYPCAPGYTPSTSPAPSYTCTTSGAATISGSCSLSIPSNSVAPALSSSSAAVGTVISATTGTWSPTPTSYTYAWWWSDGTPTAISGATSSSYTPVSGDAGHTLICKVSATNAGGTSGAVSSNATSAVTNSPTNSVAPALSSTSPAVGAAVTVTNGTWSGSPSSYTYAWWWADGTPAAISGATSSSYTPVAGDIGHTLLCKVTATGSGGTSSAVSSNTSSAVVAAAALCTGGNVIDTSTVAGSTIHKFTSSGTFTCGSARNVQVLVVAGGGGGGSGRNGAGGAGGGGGGLIYNSSFSVSTSAITVTVGAGGAGGAVGNCGTNNYCSGSNGLDSVFSSITATGGGGGGGRDYPGLAGGSGGGGGIGAGPKAGGAASPAGQGFAGGSNYTVSVYGGGGGGGAGSAGQAGSDIKGGDGGSGLQNAITVASGSVPPYYAGGGGASYCTVCIPGSGSNGVGGSGIGGNPGSAGAANTGSGGGGGANASDSGKSGGSGIVIVRYIN